MKILGRKFVLFAGDTREISENFKKESVNSIITSPPYWSLRNYETDGQLGLEKHFDEYICKLCDMFSILKNVLKDDGTCWVNIGDTYYGGGNNRGSTADKLSKVQFSNRGARGQVQPDWDRKAFATKSLCMIPFRFAIEMVNRGWILRNTIIWHKPNSMPNSMKDRFTVDFEYIFLFVKKKRYTFNQQLEPYIGPMNRWAGEKLKANNESSWDNGTGQKTYRDRNMRPNENGRNKRCVWSINTKPYKGAHFAVFPESLVEHMVLAGSNKDSIILDPFCGSGTTGVVALKNSRKFIGIDINESYIKECEVRLNNVE